jgi:hypothetical protein
LPYGRRQSEEDKEVRRKNGACSWGFSAGGLDVKERGLNGCGSTERALSGFGKAAPVFEGILTAAAEGRNLADTEMQGLKASFHMGKFSQNMFFGHPQGLGKIPQAVGALHEQLPDFLSWRMIPVHAATFVEKI